MERSKFGPFFTKEFSLFSGQPCDFFFPQHKWTKNKKMQMVELKWKHMPMNLKKKYIATKKRSVKGRKISVTYKKLRGKRLSAVQIHQSHNFHWDFSSSQSELHCPCVLKFPIQFPKRGMNLSIRLEVPSPLVPFSSLSYPSWLSLSFGIFLLNLPNHPHKEWCYSCCCCCTHA